MLGIEYTVQGEDGQKMAQAILFIQTSTQDASHPLSPTSPTPLLHQPTEIYKHSTYILNLSKKCRTYFFVIICTTQQQCTKTRNGEQMKNI